MSKAIDLNVREFSFDKECTANVGSRMFVTDSFGNNTEQFEIGDWGWAWTQIRCEKLLEKNTDYLFRFAMTGGYNDTGDAVSQLIIFFDEDWENRYVYPLDKSRFRPVVSKRAEDGLLRVFEVPFNTGNAGKTTFLLIAQHAVARFFAPYELSVYDELEDMTYQQWWEERKGQLHGNTWGSRLGNALGRFAEQKFGRAADTAGSFVNFRPENNMGHMKMSNENRTEREFGELLSRLSDGGRLSVFNCNISGEPDGEIYNNMGGPCDGAVIEARNACMTARAFGMLVNKLGDGGVLTAANCRITGIDSNFRVGGISDGTVITLSNTNISAAAFSTAFCNAGDGCVYTLENCDITAEGIDDMICSGSHGDGIVMRLNGCTVPKEVIGLIKQGFGDGCVLDTASSVIKDISDEK